MPYSYIFSAFALCTALSLGVLKFFPMWGLMDRPEAYGHKREPIPYPGGIAIFLTVLVGLLVFLPVSQVTIAIAIGAALLSMISFVDDRLGLSPELRLGIQLLAAIILVFGGIGISSISNPFGAALVLDKFDLLIQWGNFDFTFVVFADLFTIIWIMVMVNAFNWIDGVSGMSSGVAVVASAILLILSLRPEFHAVDQTLAITLSSLVLGASLAFFIFDFPPPKMLLGDTGSMLLGFLIAVTAIVSGGKVATVLLVLGFPVIDFVWVILRRLYQKKSPFKGDLWHFHHRLLKAGLSEKQVVATVVGSAALFGGLSLFLQTEGKIWAFFGVLVVMFVLASLLYSKID